MLIILLFFAHKHFFISFLFFSSCSSNALDREGLQMITMETSSNILAVTFLHLFLQSLLSRRWLNDVQVLVRIKADREVVVIHRNCINSTPLPPW